MFVLFRCVAEAVVEKGVRGLAGLVPGGPYACELAAAVWKKYRDRAKDAEIREEIRVLAGTSFEEARKAAAEAARQAAPRATVEDRLVLELYLSQLPGAVRQSLKRPADPEGRSVPDRFALERPDDVGGLLPVRMPRHKPGEPLEGKPGWSLVELLGVGGFGEVWLARHRTMTALAGAVKFCHPEHARELRHESTLINRVMAVARGRPPHTVPLADLHLDGESPWLMYEYIPGGDLTGLIRVAPIATVEARIRQAVAALRQLATAVAHFHRLAPPVVHRDLKPSNILVDRAGKRLLVTDFGIGALAARAAIAEDARPGTTAAGRLASYMRGAHTPLYSSPQQRGGSDPDPRDDVHALGVIAYQLLTGELGHGPGTDFREDIRRAGASDQFADLIGQCVANDPGRRPADAGVVLDRLAALVPGVADPGRGVPALVKPAPVPATAPTPPVPAGFVADEGRYQQLLARAAAATLHTPRCNPERYRPDSPPAPAPIPEEVGSTRTHTLVLGVAAGLGVFFMVVGIASRFFMITGLLTTLVFGLAFWVSFSRSPYRIELTRRRRAHSDSVRRLRQVEADWSATCERQARRRDQLAADLDRVVAQGRGLAAGYDAEVSVLIRQAWEAARDRHLRDQVIARADIPGIGDTRKQALAAHGILAAADVDRQRVERVEGFGPGLTNTLVAWRDELLRAFRFDPAVGVPDAHRRPVAERYQAEQDRICREAESRVRELEGLDRNLREQLISLVPEVRAAVQALSQAEADLRAIEVR